jgi:hypothetical protein
MKRPPPQVINEPDRAERRRLKGLHPEPYKDGFLVGGGVVMPGPRERDGFPKGFKRWPSDKRAAWETGACLGFNAWLRAFAYGVSERSPRDG